MRSKVYERGSYAPLILFPVILQTNNPYPKQTSTKNCGDIVYIEVKKVGKLVDNLYVINTILFTSLIHAHFHIG